VLSVIVVVGLSFTAGRRFVAWLFKVVDEREGGDLAKVSLLMVLALLFGSLTHALNIEAVLGAFIVGILAGQVKRFHRSARHVFETFTLGVFAPIFFATSGLRVDLRALLDPPVLAVGMLALLVAIVGKFAGAALGAKLSGLGRWEALSLGAGMNARGAIEIIVATIGLGLGILTPEMYTIILLIAIVTSLMAPPILRATLRHVPMTAEEERRLDDSARRERSFIASLNRVLLPTRGGGNSVTAARLLSLALEGERSVEVTTMAVVGTPAVPASVSVPGDMEGPGRADPLADEVAEAERALDVVGVELRSIATSDRRRLVQRSSGSVVDTIRAESRRGYDLLVLGATDEGRQDDASLFGGLIDRLVQDATSPVFVVRESRAEQAHGDALTIRRILLPTAGTGATRRPLEFATAIARACGARVDVLHVVERDPLVEPWIRSAAAAGARSSDGDDGIAQELLESVAGEVRSAGVEVVTHLEWAARAEQGVVDAAHRLEVDLVVLSSSVRPVTRRAFFGHRIDHVLAEADCTVLVVS